MVGRPIKLALVACSAAAMLASSCALAADNAESFMKAVNTNGDKTISMEELDAYAMKRFDALDTEAGKDDTLSMKEVGDRLTPEEFEAANTTRKSDHPSLSKAEWKAYAEKLFTEANTQVSPGKTAATGTLSDKELETPAGRKLIKMLE